MSVYKYIKAVILDKSVYSLKYELLFFLGKYTETLNSK
jgi:hypothetical protein